MGELIATERGEFWVERSGVRGGQPVVFVAGLADDHASWAPVLDGFIGAYDCITFDNRGVGRTPTGEPFSTICELADDVEALVRQLGVTPVISIGSSMGGAVCQEWALKSPDMISMLVLTNTWATADLWLSNLFQGWIALVRAGEIDELVRQCAMWCLNPDGVAEDPNLFLDLLHGGPPNLESFVAGATACSTHDSIRRLSQLTMPCLVVAGASDLLTRPSLSHQIAATIGGSQVVELNAGHMTFWERPEEWKEAVLAFLGLENSINGDVSANCPS